MCTRCRGCDTCGHNAPEGVHLKGGHAEGAHVQREPHRRGKNKSVKKLVKNLKDIPIVVHRRHVIILPSSSRRPSSSCHRPPIILPSSSHPSHRPPIIPSLSSSLLLSSRSGIEREDGGADRQQRVHVTSSQATAKAEGVVGETVGRCVT